jgi:6-phospho-beta-glucosidase
MGRNKLTLVGGGGVRGPLFVETAAARAEALGLDEIVLFDIDPDKLRLLGGVAQELARPFAPVRVRLSTDVHDALDGASFVVTTIRAGGDAGRVTDERIALRHGVLGQETVGPGGFAMALRTVPAILHYAAVLQKASPRAWLFNFTNPAGLVTQALHDEGFDRVVGICDSANLAQHAVAAYHGISPNDLRAEVFGLNHLSWVRAVRDQRGTDLLAPLLFDETFRATTMQRFFPVELARLLGTWINEYLFYFYFTERALAGIDARADTRGQDVAQRNRALLDELEGLPTGGDPAAAVAAYRIYTAGRRSTYMHYAEPDDAGDRTGERTLGEGTEGYAGVALDLIEALTGGPARHTAANVPNGVSLSDLEADDIVEVSVIADTSGIRPVEIGCVPPLQAGLMRQVKLYERLAAEAIRTRSRTKAIMAMMAHPLVVSYPRARALVDDYLHAHLPDAPSWT